MPSLSPYSISVPSPEGEESIFINCAKACVCEICRSASHLSTKIKAQSENVFHTYNCGKQYLQRKRLLSALLYFSVTKSGASESRYDLTKPGTPLIDLGSQVVSIEPQEKCFHKIFHLPTMSIVQHFSTGCYPGCHLLFIASQPRNTRAHALLWII